MVRAKFRRRPRPTGWIAVVVSASILASALALAVTTTEVSAGVPKLASGYAYVIMPRGAANDWVPLNVAGGGGPGSPVIQYPGESFPNSQFRAFQQPDGTWEFRDVYTDSCLDVPAGSTANGTQVIVWHCNGGTNQRFKLTLIAGTDFRISPMSAQHMALDVGDKGFKRLQLWAINKSPAQLFSFKVPPATCTAPVRAKTFTTSCDYVYPRSPDTNGGSGNGGWSWWAAQGVGWTVGAVVGGLIAAAIAYAGAPTVAEAVASCIIPLIAVSVSATLQKGEASWDSFGKGVAACVVGLAGRVGVKAVVGKLASEWGNVVTEVSAIYRWMYGTSEASEIAAELPQVQRQLTRSLSW